MALMAVEGYIRVAAATPEIRVADCAHNAAQILALIRKAAEKKVQLLCLPELCLTGYTCGDLFLQDTLLNQARESLNTLLEKSAGYEVLVTVGLPLAHAGKIYNVAAVFCHGRMLGFVPKTHLPNYGAFHESRYFAPAPATLQTVSFAGREVPLGTKLLFQCSEQPEFRLALEISEDLEAPCPPSVWHTTAGATIIANPSAGSENIGKADYRRLMLAGQSARLLCGYICAEAGRGESSTDLVFAGHNLIYESGALLAESPLFESGWAVSEIDLKNLLHERRRINTFAATGQETYLTVPFSLAANVSSLSRPIDPRPFVPQDEQERHARCEEILALQAAGLLKRLSHTNSQTAVIGISGGLDSCLALLVTARAFAQAAKPLSAVLAVTMPCFGTTVRTKDNAYRLCAALGVTCREIDISDSVRLHLRDIGQPEEKQDLVYENAQARIRTLVLMDLSNQANGLVIGTGDLSELALGWATYNGDHMSMYGVNAGVPKTLVRHIVLHVAETCGNGPLAEVLNDILATPVSPELLPPREGDISQQTEKLVGPYELHDFFLYHVVRWGNTPGRIFGLACAAFADTYPKTELLHWLQVFYRRFFAQQFKRNCLPDGPKIGSVCLSPRGGWHMPSDAVCNAWLQELAALSTAEEQTG